MKAAAIFGFATLLVTLNVHATIYKCVDESGVLSFGDRPCETKPVLSRKEGASFNANVLIVKSHSDISNWVKLEPGKRRKHAGRMRAVTRGTKVYLPVVATFSKSQVGRQIALVADLEIIAPNGKVTKIPNCCIANSVDPRAPTTIVLNPVIDVTFDATDPSGEYRLRATINSGRATATATETFRLQ